MAPCPSCKANNLPNCGNEHCCTRSEEDTKVWIVDCGSCGSETATTWKEAVEEGCPVCCSWKVSIYHKKNHGR